MFVGGAPTGGELVRAMGDMTRSILKKILIVSSLIEVVLGKILGLQFYLARTSRYFITLVLSKKRLGYFIASFFGAFYDPNFSYILIFL